MLLSPKLGHIHGSKAALKHKAIIFSSAQVLTTGDFAFPTNRLTSVYGYLSAVTKKLVLVQKIWWKTWINRSI
jgi:hypothetical protein